MVIIREPELAGARKVSKCEAPALVMNTQPKGSMGAKVCEFVVQPTPNMCGLGGSAGRPAVQQSRKEQFLLLFKITGAFLQGTPTRSASTD